METIGEIAAGGGSRGGGVGRGEQNGEEEGRGLLTLLHEARALLQVFSSSLSRLIEGDPFEVLTSYFLFLKQIFFRKLQIV